MGCMTPLRGAALLLCGLVLASCGQGGNRAVQLDAEVTRADLAIMVLPADELGRLADGLRLGRDDSGRSSNAAAARQSLDPQDSARRLRGAGRVDGYELTYSSPGTLSGKRKRGVVSVGSSVELMQDAVDASRFLNKRVNDYERFEGTVSEGVRLQGASTFAVPTIGEETQGIRGTVRGFGLTLHTTVVAFRRGRIVASVGVVRVDRRDMTAAATRLAITLDSRIQRVLGGQLEEDPVALPGVERRPRIDPKPLTLGLADLPPGLTVAGEGYRRHGNVRSFLREFDPAAARLGSSQVVYLRSMTQIVESEDAGRLALRYAGTPKGSRHFARLVVTGVLRTDARALRVRPLDVEGDDTVAALATFRTPKARVAIVFVYVRSGVALGSLTAVGRAAELNPGDVLGLAATIRARLGSTT